LPLLAACHRGDRSYVVYAPPPDTAPKALVVVLHGRFGTGEEMQEDSHFTPVAEREGFAVVYPDGVDRSWHDSREVGPAARQKVDDIAFISALIDFMVTKHRIDPKRVYVAGMSNGAMMTFRVACELSSKIAGIGIVAGALPEAQLPACHLDHPMPMIMFAGMNDPLVPYNGGDTGRGRFLSAEATAAWFASQNGCAEGPSLRTLDVVPDDETKAHQRDFTKCNGNADVRLYSFEGGGHTWPNGTQYLPKAVIGRVSREIDGADEMWRFFSSH